MNVRVALGAAMAGVLLAVGTQVDTVTHAVDRSAHHAFAVSAVGGAAVATSPAVRLTPPVPPTSPPTSPVPPPSSGPSLGGCAMYPADNAWNSNIRNAPLLANSTQMINYIKAHGSDNLHPDFGENP